MPLLEGKSPYKICSSPSCQITSCRRQLSSAVSRKDTRLPQTALEADACLLSFCSVEHVKAIKNFRADFPLPVLFICCAGYLRFPALFSLSFFLYSFFFLLFSRFSFVAVFEFWAHNNPQKPFSPRFQQ